MRVITNIDYIDVSEDEYIYSSYINPEKRYRNYSSGEQPAKEEFFKVNREIITGRQFCYSRDECIVIGFHSGVEKAINLPMECFENALKREDSKYKEGFKKGKNAIWDFLKINGKDTDYWWLPGIMFLVIGLMLA